jgi:hypothetical protein
MPTFTDELERNLIDDAEAAEQAVREAPQLDRLRLALSMLKTNFNLIRFADQKAQFLLRIALTMFGIAFIGVPPAVASLKKFMEEGGWRFFLFIAVMALYVLTAGCLMVSLMAIVRVVRPRIPDLAGQTGSMFFIRSIAQTQREQFRRRFLEVGYDGAVDELITDIHTTSRIAQDKYQHLDKALKWMMSGGLFGVFFALILLISWGLL